MVVQVIRLFFVVRDVFCKFWIFLFHGMMASKQPSTHLDLVPPRTWACVDAFSFSIWAIVRKRTNGGPAQVNWAWVVLKKICFELGLLW